MIFESFSAVMLLAFGLGLLHAFDADHIMAVSTLASSKPGLNSSLKYCSRWALGHGLTLLFIGCVVYVLGLSVPVELSHVAEQLVGVVLIVLGLLVLRQIYIKKAHLHFHHHAGYPRHAHWHQHDKTTSHSAIDHQHEHRAVFVGVIHGTAGSAPLMALIPLSAVKSPVFALLYLAAFSLAVLVAMLLFGGLLGGLFTQLNRYSERMINRLRTFIACASIGFGVYLLRGLV